MKKRGNPMQRPLGFVLGWLVGVSTVASPSVLALDQIQVGCDQQQVKDACSAFMASQTAAPDSAANSVCKGAESVEQCKILLNEVWKDIGPKCNAIGFYEKTTKQQKVLIPMYAATAIPCGIQCFQKLPPNPGVSGTCTALSVVSSLTETVYSAVLKKKYEQEFDALSDLIMPIGVTGLGVGLRYGGSKLAENAATKESGKGVGWSKALGRIAACAPFLMALGQGAMKIRGIGQNQESVETACTELDDYLTGIKDGAVAPGESDITTPITLPEVASVSEGAQEDPAKGGGGALKDPVDAFSSPESLTNALGAMAGNSNNKAKNREAAQNYFQALRGMGIEPKTLASAVQSRGFGPAIGQAMGLGAKENEALQKLVDATAKIASDGLSATYAGGGGKSSGKAAKDGKKGKDPFADLFGKAGSGGPSAQGGTQSFDAVEGAGTKRMAPAGEDEIFHPDYPGTIFDLISEKIRLVQPRTTELEWDYALNRAFHGLPKKDPGAPVPEVKKGGAPR